MFQLKEYQQRCLDELAERCLVFWLAPTTQIVDQTVKALRDKRHPYRQAMDADFCPSARRRWK